MSDVDIAESFTVADYRRGYVCVAPHRTCPPDLTVAVDGVWFRTCADGPLQSAHRVCAQST